MEAREVTLTGPVRQATNGAQSPGKRGIFAMHGTLPRRAGAPGVPPDTAGPTAARAHFITIKINTPVAMAGVACSPQAASQLFSPCYHKTKSTPRKTLTGSPGRGAFRKRAQCSKRLPASIFAASDRVHENREIGHITYCRWSPSGDTLRTPCVSPKTHGT